MNCPRCNSNIEDGASVCSSCGQSLQASNPINLNAGFAPAAATYSGKAIVSFVLSLVGLIIAGLICGIIGIVFSALSFNDFKRNPALRGKGLAVAGLVISIIDCVVMFVYIAVLF